MPRRRVRLLNDGMGNIFRWRKMERILGESLPMTLIVAKLRRKPRFRTDLSVGGFIYEADPASRRSLKCCIVSFQTVVQVVRQLIYVSALWP